LCSYHNISLVELLCPSVNFFRPVGWQVARLMIRSLNLHKDLTFFKHYKHLNYYKDTPKTLLRIPPATTEYLRDKKLFYIYYDIKNLILIYFTTHLVSFATFGVLSQCLTTPATITELVTNTLTNMIVLINAIRLSYLSVLLSENDPKLYFHIRSAAEKNSFIFNDTTRSYKSSIFRALFVSETIVCLHIF